mmetsp:Transcript_146299/g.407538  ORF Transcript_146299/g.407538 Transcript_146299/m.407538 type:complete len:456 (+) Transcript_146299:1599-2966(+)
MAHGVAPAQVEPPEAHSQAVHPALVLVLDHNPHVVPVQGKLLLHKVDARVLPVLVDRCTECLLPVAAHTRRERVVDHNVVHPRVFLASRRRSRTLPPWIPGAASPRPAGPLPGRPAGGAGPALRQATPAPSLGPVQRPILLQAPAHPPADHDAVRVLLVLLLEVPEPSRRAVAHIRACVAEDPQRAALSCRRELCRIEGKARPGCLPVPNHLVKQQGSATAYARQVDAKDVHAFARAESPAPPSFEALCGVEGQAAAAGRHVGPLHTAQIHGLVLHQLLGVVGWRLELETAHFLDAVHICELVHGGQRTVAWRAGRGSGLLIADLEAAVATHHGDWLVTATLRILQRLVPAKDTPACHCSELCRAAIGVTRAKSTRNPSCMRAGLRFFFRAHGDDLAAPLPLHLQQRSSGAGILPGVLCILGQGRHRRQGARRARRQGHRQDDQRIGTHGADSPI